MLFRSPPGEECEEWWKVLLSVLMTALGSLGSFGGLAYLRYLTVLKSLGGSATWRGFWDFLKVSSKAFGTSYVEVAQDACKSGLEAVTSEVGSVESVGDSVREMLPKGEELIDKMEEGMKKAAQPTKDKEKESTAKIQRFLTAMDSMTKEELDLEKPLDESRMKRISRGSGVHVAEIQFLLAQHAQMEKMVKSVGNLQNMGENMQNVSD